MRIKSNNIEIKKKNVINQLKKNVYIISTIILISCVIFSINFLYDLRNLSNSEKRLAIINQGLILYNLPKLAFLWVSNVTFGHDKELNSFKIDIKPSDYQKLMKLKNDASQGLHILSKHKIKFPATLNYQGIKYNITLRLKGEVSASHARESKWSMRVDVKDLPIGEKFYSFNLQHPQRRSFITSKLQRVIISSENQPYNDFELVDLTINDVSLGIYNLEEIYSYKSLAKKTSFPSVVFGFDETIYFEEGSIYERELIDNYYEAIIKPHQPNEVFKNKILLNQFRKASVLLDKFRFKKLSTSEVFNIDEIATWLAVGDIFGAWHGYSWGNIKFTYDINTNKIYPLVWDTIDENNLASSSSPNKALNERLFRLNDPYMNPNSVFWKELFSDPKLIKAYMSKLSQFCEDDYINKILNSNSKLINNYIYHLQKYYPQISYDEEIKRINKNISYLKTNYLEPKYPAYVSLVYDDKKVELIIINRKPIPIKIIGIRNKITNELIKIKNNNKLIPRAPFGTNLKKHIINLNLSLKDKINFQKLSNYSLEANLLGIEKIHQIEIKWYTTYSLDH